MAFFSRSFRRSVAALAAVATMLLLAFLPFVTSPKAIADVTATNVTQDGNFTNFARQGDIATIWIRDFSDNTQQGVFQGDAGFIETQDPGHGNMKVGAWSGTVNLKGTTQLPGGFSYTFKDAAILQDGSSADVKISYSNITIYTHKTENGPYTGDTYLAAATGKIHTANYNSVHIGVKMDVTVEVVNASGTFYFDSFGINTVRANQPNYQNIVGNDNNTVNGTVVGWNERLEFDADNIYVPANAQTTKFVLADNADTGHTAFSAIYSNGENGSDTNYGTGFATLTGSPSYTVTSWTGTGGFYGTPIKWNDINTRIMPGGITRKITSSSGEHGRVDTNVKGTDLSDAHPAITKAGGDPAKKDVLSVPNAKTVTYRMTPAPCYIIDTLTVDGNAVEPVTVKDSNGKILYYTYTGFGDSSDHTIHATWQPSVTVKATKTWSDYNNAYSSQPSTIDFQLKQGSTNVGSTVTVSDANSW
ncbi:MAG: hypothetical protein IKZ87_00085, partial [Actinomycetaceae bacterium]|nr:hypothetical protein [Actinomycetaceae bacterium]